MGTSLSLNTSRTTPTSLFGFSLRQAPSPGPRSDRALLYPHLWVLPALPSPHLAREVLPTKHSQSQRPQQGQEQEKARLR